MPCVISCCVSLFERYETSHENDGVSVEFADLEAFEVAYREIHNILPEASRVEAERHRHAPLPEAFVLMRQQRPV